MAVKKLARFEVWLGAWQAWVASDKCKITRGPRVVTIEQVHEEFGPYTTVIDLDQIPAYTYA